LAGRIAIIPARGRSTRLPGKNVVEFLGKPIIVWTVQAALESRYFRRVLVSTDDAGIARAAQVGGAEVVTRPPHLAADEVTASDVCLHVLETEEGSGAHYEVVACLYATAPLRTAQDIRAVVDLVEPGVCDFALAVTDYSYPPHQALRSNGGGTLAPMWPDLVTRQSQEVGPFCVDNGSTYAASVSAFRRQGHFYGPGLRGHHMPRDRSVDIDYPVDLELARFFAQRQRT
jgi:pseudaminic acid cytidylyltransferase